MPSSRSLALLLAAALLCGCASKPAPAPPPTIKSLEGRGYVLPEDHGIATSDDTTIAAYRDYLKSAPRDAQRPEAMRRLGDLEMDSADSRSAGGGAGTAKGGAENYQRAVAMYRDYLKAYPNDPNNDRVLYQLARAYELGGDLEAALRVLSQLVQQYPKTKFLDEANFRRGELLFSTRDYVAAEQAYATVLQSPTHTPYFERSLYMQGWSLYKQGRLEDALRSFFGVLDLKLTARAEAGKLEEVPGLTRADRELVEDTFRVVSLCLENLQGAESIPAYMSSSLRHDYEFRVYEQLGELYLKQERMKDAADTFGAFARRNPLHAQAPLLQARVIEIYQQGGFENMALEAKKEYVERYSVHGAFRRANAAAWERTRPLVKTYLGELTRHYHAAAQKSKKSEDYQAAVHWYREFLEAFPSDPQAAQANFLLAELLFEDSRFAEAAPEYEKAAYHYPAHAKSADAGYAALLAYTEQAKRASAAERDQVQRAGIDSALRFGSAFPADPRTGLVLSNAAEKLYALHELDRASSVAQLVLKLKPAAAPAQQRVAWTVIAHASFDSGRFDQAEHGYTEVLALTPAADPARSELTERLAAAVYKQGEQARAQGKLREAVDDFQRVGSVAPDSPVRATAQYDAAAVLISLKDWAKAARTLEDFRQRYPNHPLQGEISDKLALVYSESGQWSAAAAEFERLSAAKKDPQLARAALWQAAELYEKAAARSAAAKVYERYVRQYPEPLEPAVEARFRLARIAKEEGGPARALPWMKEVLRADQSGGAARTDRTRYLGATAALALAEPAYEEYKKVQLVEPLKKQLKLKKSKMEDVLKAYGLAADYGVADVATAATYRTAELYQDFGRALLASQRPKGLSKDEVEQYNVMLEEQAFPFEEKAIELHEVNAHRSAKGIYDQWVKGSFVALAQLRPVRYGKSERSEGAIDAIR